MKTMSGYATRAEAETALANIKFNTDLEVVGVNIGLGSTQPSDSPCSYVILPRMHIGDPANALEFDGPRRAYFEVSDGSKYTAEFEHHERDSERTMCFTYRTIGVIGEDEGKVRDWLDAALLTLRTWCDENDAMIVWRARPTIEHRPATYHPRPATAAEIEANVEPELVLTPAQWKARARFVTTMPMPPEVWAALCVKAEGEEFTRV